MVLTDKRILEEIERGDIVITPFNKKYLGCNSYDVHLADTMAMYKDDILDAKRHNKLITFRISHDHGFLLLPGRLYLGVTQEYTETHTCVPFLEGKSSIGRLGIDIHSTAGKGDIGYCNTWTLEISVKQPVIIYPGMPIGQLIYFEASGKVLVPYNKKQTAKYNRRTKRPVESMMWKNFNSKIRGLR
ncbi:MAG: dCTP deaminase [Candidatus Kryptoniota bacterium]